MLAYLLRINTWNYHEHKNKNFYRFPSEINKDVLCKWKVICHIFEDVSCRNFYICEDHFLQADFINLNRERLNSVVLPKHLELSLYRPIPNIHGIHTDSSPVQSTSMKNSSEVSKYDKSFGVGQNGITNL